jgi:hypothetical protein
MHEDSWYEDSSSTCPPAHPDDGDAVVAFLRSLGINAAEEFRHLNLAAVQERVRLLQSDPSCRPGGIVKSLRDAPPELASVFGSSAYVAQLNAKYGDLFRSGSDMSGFTHAAEQSPEPSQLIMGLVRDIAPADATEEELEWLITLMAGGTSPQAARDRLERRRDSMQGSDQRVSVREATRGAY